MFIPVRVRQAPLSFPALFPTSPSIDPTRLFQRPSPFLIPCYVGFNAVHLCPCTRGIHLVFATVLTGANRVASLKCSAQNRRISLNCTADALFGQQNR